MKNKHGISFLAKSYLSIHGYNITVYQSFSIFSVSITGFDTPQVCSCWFSHFGSPWRKWCSFRSCKDVKVLWLRMDCQLFLRCFCFIMDDTPPYLLSILDTLEHQVSLNLYATQILFISPNTVCIFSKTSKKIEQNIY